MNEINTKTFQNEMILNSLLLNLEGSDTSMNPKKKIEQTNLEKCEKASILLDNPSIFEDLDIIEDNNIYPTMNEQQKGLNLCNYVNLKNTKLLNDKNYYNQCDKVFDLTKYQNKNIKKKILFDNNPKESYCDNSDVNLCYKNLNSETQCNNINVNNLNKENYTETCEEYFNNSCEGDNLTCSGILEKYEQDRMEEIHMNFDTNKKYNNYIKKEHNFNDIQNGNNIVNYEQKDNTYIFNLSSGKNEMNRKTKQKFYLDEHVELAKNKIKNKAEVVVYKNEMGNNYIERDIKTNLNNFLIKENTLFCVENVEENDKRNKKNKRNIKYYMKNGLKNIPKEDAKEKYINMKEFEDKIKEIHNEYELKYEDIIKQYDEDNIKNKKLVNNIHMKYMNMKNELIKTQKEIIHIKEENNKLKEELKITPEQIIESNIVDSYKNKLEEYIFLTRHKDLKIKNLEEELNKEKKCIEEKEKKIYAISEQKNNLRNMNILLKKDTMNFEKKLENMRKINEELKQIIIYKEIKISYFINILNIIDEAILDDNNVKNGRNKIKKDNKQKMELDPIKNMNKKIIIKSIVHKIKDINQKIKTHNQVMNTIENRENHNVNKNQEILKNSDNLIKDINKRNQSELFDNYFDSTGFSLTEKEYILGNENKELKTFFSNVELDKDQEFDLSKSETRKEIQVKENIEELSNKG
ncbi:conserved Plasmodium protein, unknown function [Plasmodium gaboni]|uniref:Rhoptry protein n=1 Tax=Plasmodium gaboni TaxID=647221 RepID=A0ABY1UHU9_9APIC|nr:conserved Plasmodium protein, unknown function [Plasmodium gaboni]